MKKSFKVTGLKCANCAAKIEHEITKLPGVQEARLSFMTQRLTLIADDAAFDDAMSRARQIAERVEPGCVIA